jgi:Ca-activated chloride channel homolog
LKLKKDNMIKHCVTISYIILFSVSSFAQSNKKLIRQGNRLYENKKYTDAAISYQKAIEKQPNNTAASYNLGNALYKQNKMPEAIDQYNRLTSEGQTDKKQLAKVYHNLGNSYLQSQKFQESIDAYKKALRNNPWDMETKYNLALAQKMQKSSPQQKNQNNDNKQDKKDKKENKDQNNKENEKQQKENSEQQQQVGKLSKEDAKRMLQAIQNDEKNLQEKLEKEKADAKKVKPDVDW